ncbi:SPFH domain-containing protein [Sphingosinicella rhizophila]|uniref:SPFH domain-containing protein n=1 Tax=Sphingosinicella rhizophila TaxID=3050082 RepID=A0ABU3QBZ2_9SPHN|nr:SPFH domain-containing protein [Sphingosinicella sp. GR2756]MDT9600915.1 SPFH domain-containing protein [Sphingosinicella sp. GR2756]
MANEVQNLSGSKALSLSQESIARTISGYGMLLVLLVTLAIMAAGLLLLMERDFASGPALTAAGALTMLFVASGFYFLQPNQAAAILLFGDYRGTDRITGLRWRWPWLTRTKISTRVHNVTSERLKVNDLRGNPIEIACNVVWRVTDTAQALFDVDDYTKFLFVQIESALRTIGAKYPYDDIEHQETTLRSHADVVNLELNEELQERVSVAGISIDECRLTHLAYASEVAQSMLRRQQAEAVIAARQKIVIGAVSMVESALQLLSEKNVVELDDERRAAMVSNLMVVLCSESDTQPIVNAGTLYQ